MASVAGSKRIGKSDVWNQVQQQKVEEISLELGYHWRNGKLGPGQTMECLLWQVLMGNVSCDAVAHHWDGDFTASAYCQARQRLPNEVLQAFARQTASAVLELGGKKTRRGKDGAGEQDGCWRGCRVFRIDGTGLTLPDSPELRKHFGCSGRQKAGCGYPTMHLLLLTGPGGVALRAICSPLRTGDMTHACQTHEALRGGDVLLGDRQFSGWGHLCELIRQNLGGIFQAHSSRRIEFGAAKKHGPNRRFVRRLGYQDQLVEYRKPGHCPPWMDRKQFEAAPQWILVREIRREVKVGGVRRTVTVVTTLTDPKKHPAKEVVILLADRWLIETQLRWLKTTMGMEMLRCQSVDGVGKEVLAYLIVYNLIRLLLALAATVQKVNVNRLSLASALARLRWGVGTAWVDLAVLPERPGRSEPRVVKRRQKAFPRMNQPRKTLKMQIKHRSKTAKN